MLQESGSSSGEPVSWIASTACWHLMKHPFIFHYRLRVDSIRFEFFSSEREDGRDGSVHGLWMVWTERVFFGGCILDGLERDCGTGGACWDGCFLINPPSDQTGSNERFFGAIREGRDDDSGRVDDQTDMIRGLF